MACWRPVEDGIVVAVRLTPRADRDAIGAVTTLADGRQVLTARVRAVPEDGRANRALTEMIAGAVGCAKSAVEIAGGATQRIKQVKITGDAVTLAKVAQKQFG